MQLLHTHPLICVSLCVRTLDKHTFHIEIITGENPSIRTYTEQTDG